MDAVVKAGLTDAKHAFDFINKKDKQRSNYYNFYSNKRWDDLNNYDLTLDLGVFSVDEAVDIILKAISKFD